MCDSSNSLVADLRKQLVQKDQEIARLSWYETEYKKLYNERRWQQQLFTNSHFSPSQKMTVYALRESERKHQDRAREDGLTPVFMPELGEMIGLGEKTVGSNVQKLAAAGLVERDMVNTAKGGGDFSRQVYAKTKSELLTRPAKVELLTPRNQGGSPLRSCKSCHSTDLVVRKTLICRNCGDSEILSEKPLVQEEPLDAPPPLDFPEWPEPELVEDTPVVETPVEAQKELLAVEVPVCEQHAEPLAITQNPKPPRVCHQCTNSDVSKWKYNTLRATWECLACHWHAYKTG